MPQQQQPHQQQQPMIQQPTIPNLANVLGSLDPSTLGKLLSNLQQQQQQQQQPMHQHHQHHQQQPAIIQAQQPQLGADLAALLSRQQNQHHNPANSYGVPNQSYGSNAGLAALIGQPPQQGNVQVPQQQGQASGQMQAIMDELARWNSKQGQN